MHLRQLLFSMFTLLTLTTFGQFKIESGKLLNAGNHISTSGLDTIFVVENLNNIIITYENNDTTDFSWSKIRLENGTILAPQLIPSSITSHSTSTSLRIDEACGYEVEIGSTGETTKKYIWIVDYSEHLPIVDSVVVYDDYTHYADSCSHIICQAFTHSDSVVVADYISDRVQSLSRYQKIEWSASPTLEFSSNEFTIHLYSPNIPYEDTHVKATLRETFFDGTEYIAKDIYKDTLYVPVAVKLDNIISKIITRDNNNELDKEILGDIKGSAPLDINFSTSGTNSKVDFFDWEILAMAEADSQKIFFALDSFRYEFQKDINDNEESDYLVRVIASNNYCETKAQEEIKIVSSYLDASNILILGFNAAEEAQQFKVVYKSIKTDSFQGTIYNRWGRRVFTWTDPELGWDGRYNGKLVSPGVYYYVISAIGTDGEKWKVKRDLNVIREKDLK